MNTSRLTQSRSYLLFADSDESLSDLSRSRAMAVAAFDGKIIIYALKTMDEMKNGVDGGSRGDNLQPVKEVSTFYHRNIGATMSNGCFRNCTWMLKD